MASNNTKKQVHVSPGIYFSESELSVATKSLGITNLGLAGETLKGPAFQPIDISSWGQFQQYFGGTSTEKFRGSQYPKYELPYIAKTYLEESQNLKVCRVLGLSGANAGPAWIISAYNNINYKKVSETPEGMSDGAFNELSEYISKELYDALTADKNKNAYSDNGYEKKDVKPAGMSDNVFNELLENITRELYDALSAHIKTAYSVNGNTYKKKDVKPEDMSDNVFNELPENITKELYDALPDKIKNAYIDLNSTYTYDKPMVVAVIRSRGEHKKAAYLEQDECDNPKYEYDKIVYYAKKVELVQTNKLTLEGECERKFNDKDKNELTINANNYGTFGLKVTTFENEPKTYSVSFNPDDKNYIYNVIGGNPEIGDAEIYVEELYDVALQQLIERGELNTLGTERELPNFPIARLIPKHAAVNDILTEDESMLKRKDVGKRFLYSTKYSVNNENKNPLKVHVTKDNGVTWTFEDGKVGHIYTVVAYTTSEGTREYYYGEYNDGEKLGTPEVVNEVVGECVYVNADGLYYVLLDVKDENDKTVKEVKPVTLDLNNYKEQYRFSSTPWIVSELKGSANNIELTKLFRFHTISDGDDSRVESKISIENIDTELGTFDVLVRDFNDTDASPVVLERYKGVNLIPGSANYIALRIGSFDESYESKSKYITVEVNETDKTKLSIPAGFLGYPVRDYDGTVIKKSSDLKNITLQKPFLQYNTNIYDEIRIKKQYFGMSDLVGIDDDVLKYKGVEAYNDLPQGLTPCFHLDSRILEGKPNEDGVVTQYDIEQTVSVDGVTGYEWVTVGKDNLVGNFTEEPRIGKEEIMLNTIYEDKRYRKFTVCFYGGFDGWDYYRTSRSNSDDFKYQRYRGNLNSVSGEGTSFSVIHDPENYGFDKNDKVITSDWYAYLSAIRQFANPKEIDINVFATPGIDYVNNNLLVGEVIEMIEEERADSIYVITTPDKPFGAGDNKTEMFTAEDAADNLADSEIDTNWACTYYPWVKYYDNVNNQYIYLPPTKDVVKNFAYTDNVAAPWYAAAGWNRGLSDGIKSKKNLVLSEEDELYSGRINFVKNFADDGMRIWGDNNLQVAQSNAHMNKISKRRCLIRLRKLISIACIGLVFDPNDATTVASFRSAVQPILEDFIAKRALVDAKLVIDDSEEARDRLEINAQIYLKFMPNLEYINIGLIATPQGISFDDI